MSDASAQWLIPDDTLGKAFARIKHIIQSHNDAVFFDWSRTVLSEITPNVKRTLARKYTACTDGYKAAKVAGLYAFWTAKLKPGFTIVTNFTMLNEYAGVQIGVAYIKERLGVDIQLGKSEILEICETLRYHTSSPHTMMHIFSLWAERAGWKPAARVN